LANVFQKLKKKKKERKNCDFYGIFPPFFEIKLQLSDFVGFQSPETEGFFLAKSHNLANVFQKLKKKKREKKL
jgi:hypothetical protein